MTTIVSGSGASSLSWPDARTKLRGDLWRPGTTGIPDDVCDRALHAALRRLESERRWMWLENLNAALTVTVDGSSFAAPSSANSISSLAYLSGTTGYDILTPMPVARVREAAKGTFVGYPTFYALFNGTIYLDTKIKAGSQFELVFKARTPDSITAAIQNPPAALGDKQSAVLALACADVALGFLKNADEAGRHQARYERLLDILMDEEDEARADVGGSGILPDMTLHNAAWGYAERRR